MKNIPGGAVHPPYKKPAVNRAGEMDDSAPSPSSGRVGESLCGVYTDRRSTIFGKDFGGALELAAPNTVPPNTVPYLIPKKKIEK